MSHPCYRFRMPVATVWPPVYWQSGPYWRAWHRPTPPTPARPDAFPVADLAKGQPVDGLTVSSGNVPDVFAGEVLGVVDDGIAPDLDMIMVRPPPPRRSTAWAGSGRACSGSPGVRRDGRLIGAVAYGLAFGPSPWSPASLQRPGR